MTGAEWIPTWNAVAIVGNHLWQSTLFLGVVVLLMRVFKRNRAAMRYGFWLGASIKFLLPCSLLVALGSRVAWLSAAPAAALPVMLESIGRPFPQVEVSLAVRSATGSVDAIPTPLLPFLLLGLWCCGTLAVLAVWFARWRRVTMILRQAEIAEQGPEVDNLRRAEEREHDS